MRGTHSGSGGLLWFRIALLAAGAIAGLWLSFAPVPGLYQVRLQDRATFRRLQADMASAGAATQPATTTALPALPATITGDQAWQDLAVQVSDTAKGASKALLPNLDTGLGENDFYFPTDRPPLAQLTSQQWPLYVQVVPGGQTSYLQVSYLPRGVGLRHVPAELAYPLRPYALWCFLAGIAGFVLLPHSYYRWPTLRPAEITVAVVLAGGLGVIWFLPPEPVRPVESRREVSPEAVIRQEQIAKELASLQQQMDKARADLDKGSLAERKVKLDAYKALVARHAKLSQDFVDPESADLAPTTQPALAK